MAVGRDGLRGAGPQVRSVHMGQRWRTCMGLVVPMMQVLWLVWYVYEVLRVVGYMASVAIVVASVIP